jgi:hypothetical protein
VITYSSSSHLSFHVSKTKRTLPLIVHDENCSLSSWVQSHNISLPNSGAKVLSVSAFQSSTRNKDASVMLRNWLSLHEQETKLRPKHKVRTQGQDTRTRQKEQDTRQRKKDYPQGQDTRTSTKEKKEGQATRTENEMKTQAQGQDPRTKHKDNTKRTRHKTKPQGQYTRTRHTNKTNGPENQVKTLVQHRWKRHKDKTQGQDTKRRHQNARITLTTSSKDDNKCKFSHSYYVIFITNRVKKECSMCFSYCLREKSCFPGTLLYRKENLCIQHFILNLEKN